MRIKFWQIIFLAGIFLTACENSKLPKLSPVNGYLPIEGIETSELEASYLWNDQSTLNSPYWADANFVTLRMSDGKTGNLAEDGYLNANSTYQGTQSFNKGNSPKLIAKAAYDDSNIYILLEWYDTTINATLKKLTWDGTEDPFKSDSTKGWTSQGYTDNVAVIFGNSENDAWYWSVAETAPFNMALNTDESGLQNIESLTSEFLLRNSTASGNRVTPQYEWNGELQVYVPPGTSDTMLLDPAYYLLSDNAVPVVGDAAAGEVAFNNAADCRYCHGPNGNGDADGETLGGALNGSFINKYSREGLNDYIASNGHQGSGLAYFGQIENNPAAIENLITFMRAVAGYPGYLHSVPDNTSGILVNSNVTVGGIPLKNTKYTLLFTRSLKNGVAGDVQFDVEGTVKFKVRLADNDNSNYIESNEIEVVFQSNEL